MALAKHDHSLPSEHLPAEIWDKIIGLCPHPAQAVLCQVSSDFQTLGMRHLYRHIALQFPHKIVGCCRTISRNSVAASAVRSIVLQSSALPPNPLASFYRVIIAALKSCCLNLVILHLEFCLDLSPCFFPVLEGFGLSHHASFTLNISSFLQRHPTLEHLELRRSNFIEHSGPSSIYMPRLKHFGGTSHITNAFVHGSSIRNVNMLWGPDVGARGIEDALSTFAPSAKSMKIFSSMSMDLHPQLLGTLGRVLPQLSNIRLMVVLNDQVTLDSIGPDLAKFQNLYMLQLTVTRQPPVTYDDFVREAETLASWSRRAPHLSLCRLPSGITWLNAYHLLWVPQTDAPDREAWWKRMLLSGKMDHLLEGPLAPLTCENHLKPVWMEARREFMMKVPSMIKTQYDAYFF